MCAFSFSCTGGSFRGWPRARQTRRARRLSLRANTSSLMECGCRPSAGGRWRRSPTSPSEVATFGSSPTQSQVGGSASPSAHCPLCLHIPWLLAAVCCSADCRLPLRLLKFQQIDTAQASTCSPRQSQGSFCITHRSQSCTSASGSLTALGGSQLSDRSNSLHVSVYIAPVHWNYILQASIELLDAVSQHVLK